jgi:YbbR domain-containing protein
VPDRVEITGPAPQVEKLEAVLTDTFDVGRLTGSATQELALRGPEEALVTYNAERVRARVEVQEVMITREFRRMKIEIKNAAFRAVATPFQVDLTVHGPQRLVEGLRLNDGEVFVDAAGQGPGAVRAPVTILLPPGIEVVSQEPTEVELKLIEEKKKNPQNPPAPQTKRKSRA